MPQMKKPFEVEQGPILIEGRYDAVLKETKEWVKDFGEGPETKIVWVFEVEANESDLDDTIDYVTDFTGKVEASGITSMATSDTSYFVTKGYSTLLGCALEDWDRNTDPLHGTSASIIVDSYLHKSGVYKNGVVKVSRPIGKSKKKTAKAAANAEAEADFANLPA